MKKVLLPIDVSERSMKTIDAFRREFAPEQAEVTLLTVAETAAHFKYADEYQRYRQKRQKELEALTEHLGEYKVSTVVLQGNPGKEIVEYLQNNKYDMLIMTRSKRGALGKLGSVAAYIVTQAPNLDLLILRES